MVQQIYNGGSGAQPCHYQVGQTLGVGSSSVVKLFFHIKSGRHFAAKIIKKPLTAGLKAQRRNEIAILEKLSKGHPNILSLIDYFETAGNCYSVIDLALGGELFHRIYHQGPYCELDAVKCMRVILSAVAYLHHHGVLHRDLKPENILFRTTQDNFDTVMIADFGDSCLIGSQLHQLGGMCGTLGYMAPEMLNESGHGKPIDIWAIGGITYFILSSQSPFERDNDADQIRATLLGEYYFLPSECWANVSSAARDFIRRCLLVDSRQRLTSHEGLQHPWLTLRESPE